MSERFASHQVEHLFMLVGANPLPNFVAARLLAGPESHLHLVVSSQTGGVGDRLRTLLKASASSPASITLLSPVDDPSDAHAIDGTLQQYLSDRKRPVPIAGKVGLHFTSGTKPMALQAQETLRVWCNKPGSELRLSYLDPRRLSLRLGAEEIRLTPADCPIPFEGLLELHGATMMSSKTEPELPEICKRLAATLGSGADELAAWRAWCDHNLRTWQGVTKWEKSWETFQERGRGAALVSWVEENKEHLKALQEWSRWVQSNTLKDKQADLSWVWPHVALNTQEATLEEWLSAHQAETGWQPNNKGFAKMAKFLDGQWLESYVLTCIQELAKPCSLHSVQRGIEVKRQVRGEINPKPFEFDVVAMRGHRLFALSCATDGGEGLNKSKLFEIFTRARQMGGDEARFGVVCGVEDAAALAREIEESWQAPGGSVRVFGRQEWQKLGADLEEWFLT